MSRRTGLGFGDTVDAAIEVFGPWVAAASAVLIVGGVVYGELEKGNNEAYNATQSDNVYGALERHYRPINDYTIQTETNTFSFSTLKDGTVEVCAGKYTPQTGKQPFLLGKIACTDGAS